MEIIYLIFSFLFAFFIFLAYRKGLKDGMSIKGGQIIRPLFDVQPKKVREKSEEDKLLDFIDNYQG